MTIQDQLPVAGKVGLDERIIYERLGIEPHISPVVLLYRTNGLFCLGYYSHNDGQWHEQEGQQIEKGQITHWMPLPTPPIQAVE